MAETARMAKSSTYPKERYLRIPYSIFTIPRSKLDFGEKWLLAHIYSFGTSGCYQSNETLAKLFNVSVRTISLWVGKLKTGGYILWVDPKGLQRTVWAKQHPDVKAAKTLIFRSNHILKSVIVSCNEDSGGSRNPLREGSATGCARVAQSIVPKSRNLLLPTIRRLNKKLQSPVKIRMSDRECENRKQKLRRDLLAASETTSKQVGGP